MELNELQLTRPEKPKVDFARLRHSTTAVALALTFHTHLGLSLRETAFWLKKLFLLPISHQTVALWCQSIAYLVAPLVEQRIEEAEILVGDETFITVSGEEVYWWISYNPETATIVTQQVTKERDTSAAATLLKQTTEQAPQLTYFISDAFSAYALALLYLGQQQSDVPQHIVVKGLQYQGVPEDAFLWHKELIERFFRTFKQRYRRTLGFASVNGAVAFCVLFSVYYNFFRPHQWRERLHYRV
jgi:transposase-like protein